MDPMPILNHLIPQKAQLANTVFANVLQEQCRRKLQLDRIQTDIRASSSMRCLAMKIFRCNR